MEKIQKEQEADDFALKRILNIPFLFPGQDFF